MNPALAHILRYKAPPIVAASTTTWDPSNESSNISLTNSNLTATNSNIPKSVVKSTSSAASGKKFWKITVNDIDLGAGQRLGVANASAPLDGTDLGDDANSCGYCADGTVSCNGTNVGASISTYTTGDVISVAFDIDNGKIWFKVNSGNWNNDGSADPATNTNGKAVATTGPFFAALSLRFFGVGASSQMTADFAPASPPSGFGNL